MSLTRHMSKNLTRYINRVDFFLEERKTRGLGVPESPTSIGVASITSIANGTGIPQDILRLSPQIKDCIAAWCQRIGFSPAEKLEDGPRAGSKRAQMLEEKVNLYLAQLRKEGRKLPENPRSLGRPDWERISSESNIPINSLTGRSTAARCIKDAIKEIGLELYLETSRWHATTYGELLTKGSEWRKEELRDKSQPAQQLANTRSKLRYFMLHAGETIKKTRFEVEDLIDSELLEKFEETVRKLSSKIESDATRRTFVKEIRLWQTYFLRILRAKDLPAKFTDALDAALSRAALTVERLAIKVDVTDRLIYRWLNGTRTPSVESFPALRRIENALSLPPDTLVSRVIRTRAKQFAPSCYPEHITVDDEEVKLRGNKRVLLFLRPLLPDDYGERPMEERTEIATWLIKNLVRPTTAWAQWHRPLCTLPYAMKVFPPVVQEEWEELSEYKRDKLPPLGMKRNGSWSEDSASQYESNFRRLMAYLTLSTGTEDLRFRGLGLDQSHLTLAAVTCYPLIDGYFRWQARRRKDGPLVQSYSLADLHFVQMIIKLLSSESGWLRQKPELAEHLKPLPGFIDEHFIERARTDWNGLCDEAVAEYIHLAASIEEVAEEQRDPFEPILSVLDLDHPQYHDPISALRHFSQNIINDLPDPSGAPIKAANQVRNYLIVRVLSITGLRSRNIRELTYREDNTGQIRRKGDKWVVVIPWDSFKNKYSSFFGVKKKKYDYERELHDKDGLYSWIEEYVKIHRPILLRDRKSDILFVCGRKTPMFKPNKFHQLYRKLTMIYFAYNPYLKRGVPGIKPHGPHAVRDMLATFIIQKTGSYELAAYVIGDALITVREHYARFMPKDKMRLTDVLINNAWGD